MSAPSPTFLLLAAFVCSIVGRAFLFRAAWEISKGWGFAVFCVPLAPLFFRLHYKELAHEGKNWRTMTTVFLVAFTAITGSRGSIADLMATVPEKLRPAQFSGKAATEPGQPDAEDMPEGAAVGSSPTTAKADTVPVKPGLVDRLKAMVGMAPPEPAKPAAPIAAATPPPTPAGPTLAERIATNQQEFTRLEEVYENLKKEKGYLKKWDQEAIAAYNALAAKYQADLAKARAEQTELNKPAPVVAKK